MIGGGRGSSREAYDSQWREGWRRSACSPTEQLSGRRRAEQLCRTGTFYGMSFSGERSDSRGRLRLSEKALLERPWIRVCLDPSDPTASVSHTRPTRNTSQLNTLSIIRCLCRRFWG